MPRVPQVLATVHRAWPRGPAAGIGLLGTVLSSCGGAPPKADSAPPIALEAPVDSGGPCAPEELACDGLDDDCDGEIDEGLTVEFYADSDGDGVGTATITTQRCPAAALDWSTRSGDCDDSDPHVSPDTYERCNGVDDDCDGEIDEDLELPTWYPDTDTDGYGTSTGAVSACTRPDGHVPRAGDCDDTSDTVHPAAPERCDDGVDNDCDGTTDNIAVCCVATTDGTGRYVLCTEPTPWTDAEARCATEGGGLAVVDSAAQAAFAQEVATWHGASVWLGATDGLREGSWQTPGGDALPFHD